jgi:hypothetical protein
MNPKPLNINYQLRHKKNFTETINKPIIEELTDKQIKEKEEEIHKDYIDNLNINICYLCKITKDKDNIFYNSKLCVKCSYKFNMCFL